MFIERPYLPLRRPAQQAGQPSELVSNRCRSHQRPQARTGSLRDLAVLLRRTSRTRQNSRASHLQADLASEHQALVGSELQRERAARRRSSWRKITSGSSSARTSTMSSCSCSTQSSGRGGLERRLHRAAPGKRAPAIVNPRQEALLERRAPDAAGSRSARRGGRARSAPASPGCSSPRDPPGAAGGGATRSSSSRLARATSATSSAGSETRLRRARQRAVGPARGFATLIG